MSSVIDDYYASRRTLNRLETVFKKGYMTVLELIAESHLFFNGNINAEELYSEFVEEQFELIKQKEQEKKEDVMLKNCEIKKIKMSQHQVLDKYKCHALIHIKRELRQCQNKQLIDDDFCIHHSKLDVLPYGRVNFNGPSKFIDSDDNEDDASDESDES